MSQTKVFRCTCKSPSQDALYGKGRRVCNRMADSPGSPPKKQYRCAVCKAIHP